MENTSDKVIETNKPNKEIEVNDENANVNKQESIQEDPVNNTSSTVDENVSTINVNKQESVKEDSFNNKASTTTNISKDSITSKESKVEPKKRKIVENPFVPIKHKVTYLVYWENTTHSGAALATGLSILIFTSFYSLFDIFCFLFVCLVGLNTIYVVGKRQLSAILNQEPINPYENYLANKPWYVDYAQADKYIDVVFDGVNFIAVETQKIVLVDDAWRSAKHAFLVYLVLKLSSWFGLHIILGIALVLGFTTPTLYLQNKVLVDEKLDQANKLASVYYERGIDLVKQKTGGIFTKFQSNNVIKNLTKSSIPNAQKEE